MSSIPMLHAKLKATFQGIHHPNSTEAAAVTQYRGIKFAAIPGRWRQSKLFEEYSDHHDATKYGPSCPQANILPGIEDILNGITSDKLNDINIHEPFQFDEFECLNLNITVPEIVKESDKLPVMVCIHGGGHLAGRNSSWFNDGGALVTRSIEIGKPVIVVSTNHRLGPLGWLASKELLEYNREQGDEGVGNYATHDMHLGIEWIYRNIGPFGGDPDNITILGESAGAISVVSQIHSLLPGRFRRAIVQSGVMGTATNSIPSSIADQQGYYQQHENALKVTSIEELLAFPHTAFAKLGRQLQPFGVLMSRPTFDGVHYNESWREQNSSIDPATFELLIGDTPHEHTVLEAGARIIRSMLGPSKTAPISTAAFIDNLVTLAPPEKITAALSAYGITPETPQADLIQPLLHILADANFLQPTESYASSTAASGATVYRYLFDELNPFGGPSYQRAANHALDLPYIYGAPSIFADVEHPDWETRVREDIQEKWVRFAYGERLWKPFAEGGYYAFGPRGEAGEIGRDEVERRRRVGCWGRIAALDKREQWDVVRAVARFTHSLIWASL